MGKALGFALALTLALSLTAAADDTMTRGTVRLIDRADHSIVLDDGTRLWVSEGQLADLSLGDQVQAAYGVKGGKKIVTQLDHPKGLDGSNNPLDSIQAGDN